MITYNDLYEVLRKEKYSEQLQVLPKKFLEDVAEYFKEKKSSAEKQDDFFSDITIKNKKKLDNAVSNFKELLRLRKRKILNLGFVASEVGISKKDFENLLNFERKLFEEIVGVIGKSDKEVNKVLGGEKSEKKYQLVRFLEDVPKFLNFEGEEIGGFEKGEVANLEKQVADILSQDKRAEILDED
jgi:DNA replication initiation complex subunit (GINS family)